MDIKKIIKDKTCYIISNELKNEILSFVKENKLLLDIHFFTLNEVISRIYFKYDNRAIYYVSKNYNVSYANAKLLIENLKYLMYSKEINDDKVMYLRGIKEKLDKLNLLEYGIDFLDYLKRYNIISDLNPGNEFLYKINELLNKKIDFINLEKKDDISVYEFKDSDEEVTFVANEVGKLLNKDVEPNKIHVINANEAYHPYINKIFSLFNIPYVINSNNVLYDLNQYKILYSNYINNLSTLEETTYSSSFNNIVDSLNFIEDLDDKHSFLLYVLKNTKTNTDKYINVINFSSYESAYLNDHYYFFVGLNNKVFPSIKKDEDYLSDILKNKLGYLNSSIINNLTRQYALNRLSSNTNISISYRNNDYFNKYLKSDLVDELTKNIKVISVDNDFSFEFDRLRIARELDNFYKYNLKSELLTSLLSKVKKDDYKSYDNSYSKVDNDYYLNNVINNKISVSYSSFEKFNECNYKYYLDSVLKENEDSFNTYIGSLFHFILEHIYDSDFNFKSCVNNYQSEYVLSSKEELLLTTLLDSFEDKISIILEQYNKGKYKTVKKEENISLFIKSNLSIRITGFIDKIMLDDSNHAYVVDYKTGETKLTLDYLDYGLKCQLPFYFYLLHNSKEYADIFLVGCYLQVINFKIRNYKDTSKDMLLQGLTYNDEKIISDIDTFYESDSFIKGIKPNKNGLGTYAKTYTSEDFTKIISTMDTNIQKMINDIENANFDINPKMIKKKETTCIYCKYRDICYRDFKDFIDIRKVNQNEVD